MIKSAHRLYILTLSFSSILQHNSLQPPLIQCWFWDDNSMINSPTELRPDNNPQNHVSPTPTNFECFPRYPVTQFISLSLKLMIWYYRP
jgi:hypothetical protein